MTLSANRNGKAESGSSSKALFRVKKREGAVVEGEASSKRRRLGSHATEQVVIESGRLSIMTRKE